MQKPQLKRELGAIDAAAIALGAIIGAGIFVTVSEAAAIARASFLFTVPLAALVALLSGLSATELGIRIPVAGGTYAFARHLISSGAGFIIGWVFILAGITASSTFALAFAGYLNPIFPGIPLRAAALGLVLLATALSYFSIRLSVTANNILVALKIAVLVAFSIALAPFISTDNLRLPTAFDVSELFQATALMFFAYTGFARPVTLAEEIRQPEKTLPASLALSLSTSMILYLAVSITATGVLGIDLLAASTAPLSQAAGTAIGSSAGAAISAGALVSIMSVLLTEIIGLSRIIFAMARNDDLPSWLSVIHPKFGIPHRAVLLTGTAAALLATFTDLSSLISSSSLALLLYYGFTNFTALKLGREKIYSPIFSFAGLFFTLGLSFTLPPATILVNAIAILIGILYFYLIRPSFTRP